MTTENFSYQKALKKVGISYLGNTTHSAKMQYSYNKGTETYCVYIAPSNMAFGYDSKKTVCPNDKYCKEFCLNGSGHNKADILANGYEYSVINKARIKKTRLFYEDRDLFMQILIHEIKKAYNKAKKDGKEFAVRLNGTSDLSPLTFKYQGKNILEIFPDIQFYDYTKVANRFNLLNKYPNYDLTFSYNGYNWKECEKVLENNGKVAVVFANDLPTYFNGYIVENGNEDDMRYLNSPKTIIGLHYHKTANDYVMDKNIGKRVFKEPDTPFVIKENDERNYFSN